MTVAFVPEESPSEIKQEPGPDVTTPELKSEVTTLEVKPEVTTPEVKPEVTTPGVNLGETTTSKVDSLLESKKTPNAELQDEKRRQMDETTMAARAS